MNLAELQLLAQDRPLITVERHKPNDFYGHAAILKQYSGLTAEKPLKVIIQHGIVLTNDIWQVDRDAPFPTFLCASQQTADAYRALRPDKHAYPIGPMMLYVEAAPPPPKDRCLLVFPAHSSHRVEIRFDTRTFADFVARFGKQFDRVQICLYWKDISADIVSLYESYGFELTTAGHMYDTGFLPRLVSMIAGADYVLTNEVGTHIFYSVLSNKPVWLKRQSIKHLTANEQIYREDVGNFEEHSTFQKLSSLFSVERGDLSAEQQEYVAELTGKAHHRSPEQLRFIFDEAEANSPRFIVQDKFRLWTSRRYWVNTVKQRLLRLS